MTEPPIDIDAINRYVDEGFIKAIPDPWGRGMTLYNYTIHAQKAWFWPDAVRACRGLVMRGDDVLARPWRKFFGVGQHEESKMSNLPAEVPELARKYDGSLIVVFHDGERWECCTRGAWESEQANYVRANMLADLAPHLARGATYMFELSAPWNQVVIPHDETTLTLIGVRTDRGHLLSYAEVEFIGLSIQTESGPAFLRPLEFEKRHPRDVDVDDGDGTEGFVARWPNGLMVKVKFAEYLRLHRMLTGFSVREIWETLRRGDEPPWDDVPDEWESWARGVVDRLRSAHDEKLVAAREGMDIWRHLSGNRGEFARAIKASCPAWSLPIIFALLDGDEARASDVAWKQVRPGGNDAARTMTCDGG